MTYLTKKQVLQMVWWSLWKPYKVLAMKHWEEGGMIDSFAFRNAKTLTRKEFDELILPKLQTK